MIRRIVAWFKVRFVFTDEQLIDAVRLIDQVDRERLEDEALWQKAQDARAYLIRELVRRGRTKHIA